MTYYNRWWAEFAKMTIDEKVGFLFFYCGSLGLIFDFFLILGGGWSVVKVILIPVFMYYIWRGAR
jgi:hypothetical protein